jgi:ubiquinone/menaquinone biosynthesis C-methylase UbiE
VDQQMRIDGELERIRAEYQIRARGKVPVGQYGLFNEAALLHTQGVERELLRQLKRHGYARLTDATVLDVGCGTGMLLRRFLDYGAQPEHLFGLDLLADRIALARHLHPTIGWTVGSAHALPYADASFDIVMSFTLLSSILDDTLRQRIAQEMLRVRKPGGLIVCHDFVVSNPRNPAVRGVSHRELKRLFKQQGTTLSARRVTLAPPISRALAPRFSWLALNLDMLRLLDTHAVAVVYDER